MSGRSRASSNTFHERLRNELLPKIIKQRFNIDETIIIDTYNASRASGISKYNNLYDEEIKAILLQIKNNFDTTNKLPDFNDINQRHTFYGKVIFETSKPFKIHFITDYALNLLQLLPQANEIQQQLEKEAALADAAAKKAENCSKESGSGCSIMGGRRKKTRRARRKHSKRSKSHRK